MKRRLNLIIGKKQIILACLTVLLGVAIYVNYLAAGGSNIETASKVEDSASNYGDVEFVSTDTNSDTKDVSADVEGLNQSEEVSAEIDVSSSDEYFAQARLDKQASRDEAVEMLKSMYNGGDSTADELAVIAQDAIKMGGYIESETKIENLLKAQGFSDALCYLTDSNANIIVKTSGLDKAQAAVIKSTLLSEIQIPAENITIVEIK